MGGKSPQKSTVPVQLGLDGSGPAARVTPSPRCGRSRRPTVGRATGVPRGLSMLPWLLVRASLRCLSDCAPKHDGLSVLDALEVAHRVLPLRTPLWPPRRSRRVTPSASPPAAWRPSRSSRAGWVAPSHWSGPEGGRGFAPTPNPDPPAQEGVSAPLGYVAKIKKIENCH